jgi:hypothetical protein
MLVRDSVTGEAKVQGIKVTPALVDFLKKRTKTARQPDFDTLLKNVKTGK